MGSSSSSCFPVCSCFPLFHYLTSFPACRPACLPFLSKDAKKTALYPFSKLNKVDSLLNIYISTYVYIIFSGSIFLIKLWLIQLWNIFTCYYKSINILYCYLKLHSTILINTVSKLLWHCAPNITIILISDHFS